MGELVIIFLAQVVVLVLTVLLYLNQGQRITDLKDRVESNVNVEQELRNVMSRDISNLRVEVTNCEKKCADVNLQVCELQNRLEKSADILGDYAQEEE